MVWMWNGLIWLNAWSQLVALFWEDFRTFGTQGLDDKCRPMGRAFESYIHFGLWFGSLLSVQPRWIKWQTQAPAVLDIDPLFLVPQHGISNILKTWVKIYFSFLSWFVFWHSDEKSNLSLDVQMDFEQTFSAQYISSASSTYGSCTRVLSMHVCVLILYWCHSNSNSLSHYTFYRLPFVACLVIFKEV